MAEDGERIISRIGGVRMKEVIDRFVQLTVVQCDLCDRNSETNRMSRCYGCRRDICQKHTNFEDLDNNDYIVALCSILNVDLLCV